MEPTPLLYQSRTPSFPFFFFFNDTATTEIYTLSLHDALPIWIQGCGLVHHAVARVPVDPHPAGEDHGLGPRAPASRLDQRSEEHTSELQSLAYLVCRLLLEKKNHLNKYHTYLNGCNHFNNKNL